MSSKTERNRSSTNPTEKVSRKDTPASSNRKDTGGSANQLRRKNSLLESSKVAEWTNDVLIKEMDKFASARSLIVGTVMMYFLGHNLNNFLWLYIIFTVYIVILRFVRWWVKRWLFYLFEFCYFGMIGVIFYLLFFPSSKDFFITIYVISTGVMGIAIILFSNQAAFNSTDHISSAWLHTMPMLASFAIRWRERLYPPSVLQAAHFNFVPVNDIHLETYKEMFTHLVLYPFYYWCLWAVYYVFFFYICCAKFIPKYQTGLDDFKEITKNAKRMRWLCGDSEKYTKFKYLLQHLMFFSWGLPGAILSFHSFTFNILWITILIWFLVWNASSRQAGFVNRKVKEKLQEEVELFENSEKAKLSL